MSNHPVRFLLATVAVVSFVTLAGCDKSDPAAKAPAHSHDHSDHDHAHDEVPKTSAAVPADYPLKTCVVSGEELGSMGKPVKVEHDGEVAYLCCDSCTEKFEADPAKYLAKLKPPVTE